MARAELTEAQRQRLVEAFGRHIDVNAEIVAATEYAMGRPYKNFARFVWNWCVRAKKWKAEARGSSGPAWTPDPSAAPQTARTLPRDELEALLQDESEMIREMAREQLEFLDSEGGTVQDGTADES